MPNDKMYSDLCKKYKAPMIISYEWKDYWEKAISWSINNNRLDFLKELVIYYPKQENLLTLLERERNYILTSTYQRTIGKKILSYLVDKVSIPSSSFVIGESIIALVGRNKLRLLELLIEKAQESNIKNINEVILENLVASKSYEMVKKFLNQQQNKKIEIKNKYEQDIKLKDSVHILTNNILYKVIETKDLPIANLVFTYFNTNSSILDEAELIALIKHACYENSHEILDFLLKQLFIKSPSYQENNQLLLLRTNLNSTNFIETFKIFTINNVNLDDNRSIITYINTLLRQEKINDILKILEEINFDEKIKIELLKNIIYSKTLSVEDNIILIKKLEIKTIHQYQDQIMNNLYWSGKLNNSLSVRLINMYITKDYFIDNEEMIYKTLEGFLKNNDTNSFIKYKNKLDDLIVDKERLVKLSIQNKNIETLDYLQINKDENFELTLFNIIYKQDFLKDVFSQKVIEKYISFNFLKEEANNNRLALIVESLLANNEKEKSFKLLKEVPLLFDIDKNKIINKLIVKENSETINFLELIKYKEIKNYENMIMSSLYLNNKFNTVYGALIIDNCISVEFLKDEYLKSRYINPNEKDKAWIATLRLKRELSKENDNLNKPNRKMKV